MLTQEIIKANEALSALSDEQVSAIEELSRNDENATISKRIGEIYGGLDGDILEVSGIAKNGIEKTYDYAKRVLTELKGQITKLTADNEKLTKSQGGEGEALKQARADLASITKQYNELNDRFNEAKAEHKKALFSAKVDYELQAAAGRLKFKPGLPESVTRIIVQQAAGKIKAMSPEEIDDGDGGKLLVFKGEDGAILRNQGNKLLPYTAAELLGRELETMGVLDKGRKQTGSGTQPTPGDTGGNTAGIDGARTRLEAEEMLRKQFTAQGLTVGSAAYQEAMDKAWKDYNVGKLPER